MMTNFSAMGLGHLNPHQSAFHIAPSKQVAKTDKSRHPATRSRAYTASSVLCETQTERIALRKQVIAEWEANILRINKSVDLGAHGGKTKGQKAPR
jgi:hypothetical protein